VVVDFVNEAVKGLAGPLIRQVRKRLPHPDAR
jgi:hypothetical protein